MNIPQFVVVLCLIAGVYAGDPNDYNYVNASDPHWNPDVYTYRYINIKFIIYYT
jgi:hypothetical protein